MASNWPWRAPMVSSNFYDVATGHPSGVLTGHTREVYDVAYSRDGRRVVTCGWDETVRIWDSASGNRSDLLGRHDSFVRAVAFSPDGRQIASASQDNTVRLWDTESSKPIGILRGHSRFVTDVAFSPDGRRIASASEDGTVKIWDDTAAGPARTLPHDNWVPQVAFFPDGSTSPQPAGTTQSGFGTRRRVARSGPSAGDRSNVPRVGPEIIHGLAISPDGRRIASTNRSGTVRLWDASDGRLLGTLSGHADRTIGVAFHPGGRSACLNQHGRNTPALEHRDRTPRLDIAMESSVIASAPPGRVHRLTAVTALTGGKSRRPSRMGPSASLTPMTAASCGGWPARTITIS